VASLTTDLGLAAEAALDVDRLLQAHTEIADDLRRG